MQCHVQVYLQKIWCPLYIILYIKILLQYRNALVEFVFELICLIHELNGCYLLCLFKKIQILLLIICLFLLCLFCG